MRQQSRLLACVFANLILTLATVLLVVGFASGDSTYFRFGPSATLHVISVDINTWLRWCTLVGLIAISRVTNVVVNDVATPIFGFSIYNPDRQVIKGYTPMALQVQANLMFAANNLRSMFGVVVAVSQVDLALISVVVDEVASIFTIRFLLRTKRFLPDADPEAQGFDEDSLLGKLQPVNDWQECV